MKGRRFHYDEYLNDTPLKSRPFEGMGKMLAQKAKAMKKRAKTEKKRALQKDTPEEKKELSDEELFLQAMEGVVPLENKKGAEIEEFRREKSIARKRIQEQEIEQGLKELMEVVKGKRPIPVEKTPEYMDGPAMNMDRQLVKRLRSGQFAIQAYCELHGLRADEALNVCDGFMADSIMNNYRAVAFIHGRGKSSPGKPVLKELVRDFLNRGRFRRYVLAYSSAPSWDGGPGVTYVLLRKRPVSKRRRK